MHDLDAAEKGLRIGLEKADPRVHNAMLGAVIAVRNRGGRTDHIFEQEAITTGLSLAEEHAEV